MDDIWNMAKLLFLAVYLFTGYLLAPFVVVDSAVRLAFGFCKSRKGMAIALLLALPVTIWHVFPFAPHSTWRDNITLALSAVAVAGLVFFVRAMRGTPPEAKRPAIDILTMVGVSAFWFIMLILAIMKNGFIAH